MESSSATPLLAESRAPPAGRLVDRARAGLVGATLGTVALNVGMTALGFLGTLALTHALGAGGFGAYSFSLAWATLLTVPATLGMTPLVVRSVAAYRERSAWGPLRGILRRSNQLAATIAAIVAAAVAGLAWLLIGRDSELLSPMLVGMLLVPVLSLITMRQAAMQGLGRVVAGRVPETLVAPGAFLAMLLAAPLATGGRYSASAAMGFQVAATVLAFGLGAWLLRRAMPTEARAVAPMYETRAWLASGMPLFAASVVMAVNTQLGTILVGAFAGSAETGVFAAASRAAMFVGFLYLAATYPLMPAAARLHAAGRSVELERLLSRAARTVALASIPIIALFVGLAPQILHVFGGEFDAGAASLRILVVGQVVNMITGYGGLALLMTAHERAWGTWIVVGAVVNVVVSLVLIPPLGAEGAAIAAALSVAASNLPMVVATRRRLGIWTPVIPVGPRRRASRAG